MKHGSLNTCGAVQSHAAWSADQNWPWPAFHLTTSCLYYTTCRKSSGTVFSVLQLPLHVKHTHASTRSTSDSVATSPLVGRWWWWFPEMVSCSLCYPWTCCVTQDNLKLLIPLHPSPKCWDFLSVLWLSNRKSGVAAHIQLKILNDGRWWRGWRKMTHDDVSRVDVGWRNPMVESL